MTTIRLLVAIILSAGLAHAQSPRLDEGLPQLVISEQGELVLEQDTFHYRPWSSDHNPGKPHVIQYIAGTLSASKTFEPFTDRLQESFSVEQYHVTTLINLDAALWGTSGFVVAELKSSKRKYPLSTIVLDQDGTGASTWNLGRKGALLAILDAGGTIRYLAREAIDKEEIERAAALVGALVDRPIAANGQ